MKKLFALILCIALAFSLAACGSSAKDSAALNDSEFFNSAQIESGSGDLKYTASNSTADSATPETPSQTSEKIIKTVDLSVQTKEYDAYVSALTASISANGGYVEKSESGMGGYRNSNRYSTYVVRIPSDKPDAFLTAAGKNGKIVSKTENQQNVTLEYVDLESRISAYKTEKETLTKLLEKAESLENVLSIQERLSEVNYQIESYTSQLRVLENRVSYSTVTLNISEVERVTETEPTLWQRIKNSFLDNVDNLVDGLEDIAVGILGGLPIILPVIAAAVIVILIVKKLIKRRNRGK